MIWEGVSRWGACDEDGSGGVTATGTTAGSGGRLSAGVAGAPPTS